jgi:hypothetical protein
MSIAWPFGTVMNVSPGFVGIVCAAVAAVVTVVHTRRTKQSGQTKLVAKKSVKPAPKPAPWVHPTHPDILGPPDAEPLPTSSQIDAVRHLMGDPPRRFDPALATYLTVLPPKWLAPNPNDEMWLNVHNQECIRRDGRVVWGTVVQANNVLFKRVNLESGASVIYSPDPWFDRHRDELGEIAQHCFALKGTDQADLEAAAFARMLTNELTRGMRLKVPRRFTAGREVYHSSMLMPRKHLPNGILSGRFFPIWIDPQPTGAMIMVPAAYLPASLTREWDRV